MTWSCTGSPCPWGNSDSNDAIVWPASASPSNVRHGYTVSAGIYLPAVNANGMTVSLSSGTASAYAGLPDQPSHRLLGSINPGSPLTVTGIGEGEVVSVQGGSTFTYTANPGSNPVVPGDPGDPPDPGGPPGDTIHAQLARWRCNSPGCTDPDWTGAVINWPSNTAYHTNDRNGFGSRSVFSVGGQPLHPYMGAWADGCEVTAVSGLVLIIEWERGTDQWRETYLDPGESHVIDLVSPEDGAMIETAEGWPAFSITLRNCTPQPLPT